MKNGTTFIIIGLIVLWINLKSLIKTLMGLIKLQQAIKYNP